MTCVLDDSSTILDGLFKWSQVSQTLSQNISCGDPASIRPDVGGSFVPWPITLLLFCFHLPTVIVRIAAWEKAQTWSLALATFEAGVLLLAFISSHLAPEKVMVWSTIVLVISAGAMLQQFVLLVEKNGYRLHSQSDHASLDKDDRTDTPLLNPFLRKLVTRRSTPESSAVSYMELGYNPRHEALGSRDPRGRVQHSSFEIPVMIASLLLFFCVVALQIRGLVAAIKGRNRARDLEVSWCSPIFSTFSIAVQDGNCEFHRVYQAGKKGTGCIKIPASEQKLWLVSSIVLNSVFLFVEFVDFAILVLLNAEFRLNVVKMKRPWMTMFSGVIVLLVVLASGIIQSRTLPPHITEKVWIVMKIPPQNDMFVCTAILTPAGLRGQIISWTDGLFSSWGSTYYGTHP